MGVEQLLATHSKSAKVPHLNAPKPGHVMGHFSHVPITGFMSVGEAGIAGMFMGCSISMSTSTSTSSSRQTALTAYPTESPIALSLLAPLSLAPSSWQFDLTLALLQGEVPEETLLVVLAEEYLGDKSTDHPPTVSVFPMSPFSGGSRPDRNPWGGVVFFPQSNTPGGAESTMRREGTACPSLGRWNG